jgi:hypothetical protein
MPTNRWTLTRSQKSKYSRAVERMRAAGADLAPFAFDCPWVRVNHCLAASWVRTWTGDSVFVIYVRIVGLAPKTIVRGFELTSPQWEFDAYVLDDPTVRNSALQLYRMLDGSSFHRSEVLNHRVGSEGLLHHGDLTKGSPRCPFATIKSPQCRSSCRSLNSLTTCTSSSSSCRLNTLQCGLNHGHRAGGVSLNWHKAQCYRSSCSRNSVTGDEGAGKK